MISKLKTIFLSITIFSLTYSPTVFAYECSMQSVEASYEKAHIVFSGKIVKIKQNDPTRKNGAQQLGKLSSNDFWPLLVKADFEINQIWKGKVKNKLTIYIPSNCNNLPCIDYTIGEKYLLFAYLNKNNLLIPGECFPSKLLFDAQEEIKELNKVQRIE